MKLLRLAAAVTLQLANLNFATQEKRQLGSAIKPILSYGPAIEYLNWSTGQTVHDAP